MRVAVTGASGFIGGAVATHLADHGHDVVGFGRRREGWSHPAARYEVWDLTGGTDPVARDVEAVVHAAALADDWAPYAQAARVNVDGTRAMLAAFPAARIVHLSTSSVYDAFTPTIRAMEDAPLPARFLSAYSATKAAAEAVLAGPAAAGREVVILRPHAVYGAGDTTLLPRVVGAVRGGVLRLPGGAEVLHTLTHVENLAAAVELALTGPAGTYNVGDDGDVLLSDVLREFLAARGMSTVRIRPVPYRVASAAAGLLEGVHRVVGGRPRITRYAISQLGLERTLDLTAARTRLRYTPASTTLAGAATW